MSDRVCIVCKAPYGKMHVKNCPAYVEPTYTKRMIEDFIRELGRESYDPVDGVKKGMIFESDLNKLEEKFFK